MRTTRSTVVAAATAALLTLMGASPARLAAQDSTAASQRSPAAGSTARPGMRFAKYRQYPWNGVSLWAGGAHETRTASHNEEFNGSMRVVGLQVSRDIWRGRKTRIAYVGEVLPIMLVRSGPPVQRMPDTARLSLYTQAELRRFRYRDAYGFGVAPFGAEVTYRTSRSTSALFNITAGGLLFSKIVPYGRGTQPNFTVSPGVALQWAPVNRSLIAFGYTFHHLSNASFGDSNPGMNSQILYVRVSRLRKQAPWW